MLEKALQKYPDDADVNFAYGKALYKKGEVQRAAGALDKSLKKAPGHPEANGLLGLIRYAQGDLKNAEKHLDIAQQSMVNADVFATLGAIRLAKPDSPWSKWRYGKRPKKLARSQRRYGEQRQQRLDRLRDLLGGSGG